ncbi:unnamed protein product [Globisporangium polare]
MNLAALSGHLDIVKFLHKNRREGCTDQAVSLAARYLHFVDFLHASRSEGCSRFLIFDAPSCLELMEMAQWLDEKYPGVVNTDQMARLRPDTVAVLNPILSATPRI